MSTVSCLVFPSVQPPERSDKSDRHFRLTELLYVSKENSEPCSPSLLLVTTSE